MKHCNDLQELLKSLPNNKTIVDNAVIAWSKINSPLYKTILCSVSGGADSDVMLDICYKCDKNNKIKYVWFDTGLEYEATKKHLKYLENKYNIKIERVRAKVPIPLACKNYGVPFLSKEISYHIHRLQQYNFEFDDSSDADTLIKKYCKCLDKPIGNCVEIDGKYYKGCVSDILWWCNSDKSFKGLERFNNRFKISYKKYLKEFLIENPPKFKISSECCKYAKKDVAKYLEKLYSADLQIIGVRKAEGGIRSVSYKNCFSSNCGKADQYRPLFWYIDKDRLDYELHCNIQHSDCYTKWGFNRTGCCGCPYSRDLETVLNTIEVFEPKLYKAVNNVFKDSYEYLDEFLKFRKEFEQKELGIKKLF